MHKSMPLHDHTISPSFILVNFVYKTCYIGHLLSIQFGKDPDVFPPKLQGIICFWLISFFPSPHPYHDMDWWGCIWQIEEEHTNVLVIDLMCCFFTRWPNLGRLVYTDYLILVIIYCIIVLNMYKQFLMHFFQLQGIICYRWWWWWPYMQPICK